MKKKLLLIFFIVLIVIFLIIFINNDDNINEIINNTISDRDEYKITLTLKNIYYLNNNEFTSKIVYIEQRKNEKYKITNKIFENNTLKKENIKYLDGEKYYILENGLSKEKEFKNIEEIKDFDINYDDFFKKIKSINKIKTVNGKEYYRAKMKSEDAFSLIYNSSKNNDLEKYTYVTFIISNNNIETIKLSVKDKKSEYIVKLDLDFGLQKINVNIKG